MRSSSRAFQFQFYCTNTDFTATPKTSGSEVVLGCPATTINWLNLKLYARIRVPYNRGWAWAQAPILILVGANTICEKVHEWWDFRLPLKWVIPAMLFGVWLLGELDIRLGLMQAENDRNAALNPCLQRIEKMLGELKETG